MGEISGRLADFTVITTDNPRNESPQEIMAEIETGVKKSRGLYKIIENRKEAIRFAMRIAWKMILLLLLEKDMKHIKFLKIIKR